MFKLFDLHKLKSSCLKLFITEFSSPLKAFFLSNILKLLIASRILTRVGGKISFGGEVDYRPELRRIKSVLLTKLMISELDPEINAYVSNDAKEILS